MTKINHIGLIVDGNGRWAKERGQKRSYGHKKGAEALEKIILYINENKIANYLSLYVFSTENFNRSEEEVNYLMELFMKHPKFVFSTEHIMEKIWEQDGTAGMDVVWTYIGFLRKKIKQLGATVEIKTVRGAGYSLEEIIC